MTKANPFLEPHKFGLTTHQVDMLAPLMDEADRNARAYGWEIGHGKPMAPVIDYSPDNPFLKSDWRNRADLYTGFSDFGSAIDSDAEEIVRNIVPTSDGGDPEPQQREDPVRGSGNREESDGSGLLPDEGGTG